MFLIYRMVYFRQIVLVLVIIFGSVFQSGIDAAQILAVFPIVCKSHFFIGESLSMGLARAGHQVTLVSPFSYKSPVINLEVVKLTGFIETLEGMLDGKLLKCIYHKRINSNYKLVNLKYKCDIYVNIFSNA